MAGVAVYMGAPVVDGLLAVFLGWLALAVLFLVSAAELVVGLVARRRLLCLDGALRGLLVLALASPLGLLVMGCVPIAWSFVQSFDPTYACRDATCEDAVVSLTKIGGEMLTPQCYIELVRLADARGGRAAAVRVLQKSWPSFAQADGDRYAEEAGLLSFGRGFYRADRCEDWNAPRSMREPGRDGSVPVA